MKENLFESLELRELFNLERSYRLIKYFLGEPQPPFKLIITPTDRCNLNCIFCPNYVGRQQNRYRRENELEKEEWLDVIKQAVELGIRQWCILGGGEPLLRSEIILPALEIIKRKYRSIEFEIITNGTLFTNELLEGLVKICEEKREKDKEHALIQLTISIRGFKKTYQEITGFDMYERVIKNLSILRDLKKKANLRYPLVQINIVFNKKNMNEIERLLDLFSNELKVEQIAIHGMRAYPETKEIVKDIIPSLEETKSIVELVNKRRKNWKSEISLLPLTSHLIQIDTQQKNEENLTKNVILEKFKFLSYRCFEPWYDMMINPDGTVARCAAYTTRDEPVSVRKSSLKEIWFGEYFNQIRENIINGKMMEGCNPCGLMSNTIIVRETLKMFIEKYLEGNLNSIEKIKPLLSKQIEKEFGDNL
jgi:MoaA/NifB/PqqE/SkfB family radical SAM enzyme